MRTRQNTETRTQMSLILTLMLTGLLLLLVAEAGAERAKEAKGGLSTRAIQRGEGVREDSSKQNLPAEQKDPPTRTAGAGLQAVIVASREEGMVPFAVFFEGTNSRDRNGNYIGDSTTTADPQSVGLLGNDILEYTWDFGEGTENDPGGRYFSGFNAAHVYETPGTYTVTLTIRDELGEASTTIEVNAQSSDGLETYCFSNDADFTGCPEGAQHVTTSAFTGAGSVIDRVGSNRRLLLRKGNTFTYSSKQAFAGNNIIIGAFGSGDRPLIQYTGTASGDDATAVSPSNVDMLSLVDLVFNLRSTAGGALANGVGGTDNLLVLHTGFAPYHDNVLYADGAFIVDSTMNEAYGSNLFFYGSRLAIINSDIGTVELEHNLYGDVIDRAVITGNHFHDSGKHGLRIAGNGAPGSWNVVVSDNKFERNGLSSINLKVTTPGSSYSGNNILIERNHIHGDIDNDNDGYRNIVIRNNIIKNDGVAISLNCDRDSARPGLHGVQGLWIYGNTIYITGTSSAINVADILTDSCGGPIGSDPPGANGKYEDIRIFDNIIYGTSASSGARAVSISNSNDINDITSDNNLFYFPARTNADIFWVGSGPLNIQEWQALANNPDTNSLCADDPDLLCNDYNPSFITDPPSLPEHFRLNSTSPAIDTGMSLPLVYEDYDNNPRPIDGDTSGTAEWDIGAYEYALLTLIGDFDADGDVDMDDYAMFEEAYTGAGRPVAPGYEYADLDGDGDVDLDDFSIFAANYTG